MIRIPSLAALALAAFAFSPLAQAQYDRPIGQPLGQPYGTVPYGSPVYGGTTAPYGSGQSITCESRDGGYQECGTPFRGRPVLAEVLSSSSCIEGQTWGTRGVGSVWVTNGCRARFTDTYDGQAAVGGYGDTRYSVRCESDDGRQRECQAPVQTRLTLQRQISDAPCIEGQTWGSTRNGRVWVRGGCRGDFGPAQGWGGTTGYGQTAGTAFRCESEGGRHQECRAPMQGRQVMVRQLSDTACVEGQTWGSRDGGVWVRGGCRGEFAPAGGWGSAGYGQTAGTSFRCESEGGRHQECRAPVQGRQTLVRQLSDTACVEGQTWGSRDGGVWVRGGCRGEFAPTGGWGSSAGYGYGYAVTCESIDQRQNRCTWDGRQGRPVLVEQLSQDACVEGRNWGYDGRGQIWVDRGCRGRFGVR